MYYLYAISYFRLSGTHPFNADNSELGHQIMNEQLTFPQEVWGAVSAKGNFIVILSNKFDQTAAK